MLGASCLPLGEGLLLREGGGEDRRGDSFRRLDDRSLERDLDLSRRDSRLEDRAGEGLRGGDTRERGGGETERLLGDRPLRTYLVVLAVAFSSRTAASFGPVRPFGGGERDLADALLSEGRDLL